MGQEYFQGRRRGSLRDSQEIFIEAIVHARQIWALGIWPPGAYILVKRQAINIGEIYSVRNSSKCCREK